MILRNRFEEAFRFFADLERNNRKERTHANRERYESHIVMPLRRLLEAWIVRGKMKPGEATKAVVPKKVEKVFKDLVPLWRMTSAREWNT